MSVKSSVSALLHRPMDRTEFMKTVGIVAIALSGVASIIAVLARHGSPRSAKQTPTNMVTNYGYKKRAISILSKKA